MTEMQEAEAVLRTYGIGQEFELSRFHASYVALLALAKTQQAELTRLAEPLGDEGKALVDALHKIAAFLARKDAAMVFRGALVPGAQVVQMAVAYIERLSADNARKAERIARLEVGLEFYADLDLSGYDVQVTNYGLSTEEGHIIRDGGDRARRSLFTDGGPVAEGSK